MRLKLASSIVISALAVSASPALAQEKRTEAGDMTAAISRDLGLSPDQVKRVGEQQERAIALDERLQKELGDGFAGSHFDLRSGRLVVNVVDRALLDKVKSTGATPKLVAHSLKELTEVKLTLGGSGDPSPTEREFSKAGGAFAALALDPVTNTVKITATKEQSGAAREAIAKFGDAVSVESIDTLPEPTYNYMDGGDGYNGNNCSAGFNLRNPSTGARMLLTAGHCLDDGEQVNGQGNVFFGFTADSWFPGGYDDAVVRNQNTGHWIQGPWFDSNPSNGAFHSFSGSTDAPVGTVVCKSGINTKFTCGQITVKNEDVTYSSGAKVNNMTRHSACVQPGDSGGSNLSWIGGQFRAEGVTSGARMRYKDGKKRCLSVFGETNVSWYFPIADSLPYYGAKYGVTLW